MRKFLLLVFLSVLGNSVIGQVPTYHLDKIIGLPLSFPNDITVDAKGNIYITDNRSIKKLNAAGEVQMIFDAKGGSLELTVDGAGNIYISDYSNAQVLKYNPKGELLLQFGSYGSEKGQFKYPQGIAVDAAGDIYVADTDNRRVQKFTNTGEFLFQLDSLVSEKHQSVSPSDVTVDAKGNIYVLADGILKYNASGQFLAKFGSAERSPDGYLSFYSIVVDIDGNMFVADGGRQCIRKYNAQGQQILQVFGSPFFNGTKISVSVDASGNLYVADRRHHGDSHVQKFNPDGKFIIKWGGELSAKAVAVDKVGNFYIAHASKIQKYNASGQPILKFGRFGFGDGELHALVGVAVDRAGNVYTLESTSSTSRIQKFSSSGRFLQKHESSLLEIEGGHRQYTGIAVDAIGNMYLSDYYGGCIRKLNPSGHYVQQIGIWGKETGQLWVVRGVALDAIGNVYALDFNGHRIQKFSPSGKFLSEFGAFNRNEGAYSTSAGLAVDAVGNVYTAPGSDGFVQIYNSSGQPIEKLRVNAHQIAVNANTSKIVAAGYNLEGVYLFSSSSTDIKKSNFITGNIFEDRNANCAKETEEVSIPRIVVVAEPGPYYGISDENGSYTIEVDTGSYTISQMLPEQNGRIITQACPINPTTHTVSLSSNQTVTDQDFGNKVVLSPYLSAHVSSNRRRRCFTNTTIVSYSNTGFAATLNAKIFVQLPQHVVLKSADKPFTRDQAGNYIFELGTLAANQSGNITILDSVACGDETIRGLTVCTKSWIMPSNSYSPTGNWDQSDITLESRCLENGFARLAIKNSGVGNMADSLSFRIFLDAQLALQHSYKLIKGDSLILTVPANGKTVRMEVDQHPDHPRKKQASITIEGCGTNGKGTISTGFVNALPADDAEPEVAVDCQSIIDSFDPNDKQVTPTGLTAEKYTATNAELHYQIRFQNTGTDVAYRVVVIDTLSEHLDLATLQMGSASHAYQLSVSGKGRPVLTWIFDAINLPDSAHNQAGSNGFIQFSIKPKAELPVKSAAENFADIVFDYNKPVRTNTTLNTLYDLPLQVVPSIQLDPEKVITTPKVSAVIPLKGRPGIVVTLTGKNFSATATNNSVKFNGKKTAVLQATTTSLTVRIPNGASTGKISVQTPDGSCQSVDDFVVFKAPTLNDFTPKESKAAEALIITLTGTHFSPDPLQDTVYFNGTRANVLSATATKLTVEVPSNATTGNIRINSLGGSVQSAETFVIWQLPALTILSPATGKVGSTITLTGKNFAENPVRNTVLFGEVRAEVLQASSTVLRVQVPVGAQTNRIRIQTPGGVATSLSEFVAIPAPIVIDFMPKQGSTGTAVTLEGTYFNVNSQSDTVRFNGLVAKVLKATPTQLTVRVPFGAESGQITVDGVGGRGKSREAFSVVQLSLEEAIQVYPNPADGKFFIDATKADFVVQEIRVYSLLGTQVLTKRLSGAQEIPFLVELPNGAHGIYIAMIQTEKGLVFRKIALK